MKIDETPARSAASTDRRGLLGAAAAGMGAAVAGVILLPGQAQAANGQALVLGQLNASTATTELERVQGSGPALQARSLHVGVLGVGSIGLAGESASGLGVQGVGPVGVRGVGILGAASGPLGAMTVGVDGTAEGEAAGSAGVRGKALMVGGSGVSGEAAATTGESYGVLGIGRSPGSRGVFGWSGAARGGGTGVFGQAQGTTGVGVRGMAYDGDPATGHFGTGVIGFSGYHARATWPTARAGTGVLGISPTGTGVRAESTSGTALDVRGKVRLSRSGRVVVHAGKSSTVVAVRGGLDGRSNVSATPQTHLAGVFVTAAVPDPAHDSVTIHLSKSVPAGRSFTIAWFINEY